MKRTSRNGIICVRVSVLVVFSYAMIFLYFSPSKKNVVVHGDSSSDLLVGDKKTTTAPPDSNDFAAAFDQNKAMEFDIKVTTKKPKPVVTTTVQPVEIEVQARYEDEKDSGPPPEKEPPDEPVKGGAETPVKDSPPIPAKEAPEQPAKEPSTSAKEKENVPQADSKECPGSVLTVEGTGNVTSLIWAYVSVYSASKTLPGNRVPYVPKAIIDSLSKIFDNLNLPQLESISIDCACSENTTWKTPNVDLDAFTPIEAVGSKLANLTGNVILPAYTVLLEPVVNNFEEIKKVLTYKKEVVSEAVKTMNSVKSIYLTSKGKNNDTAINVTYVGVSVTRAMYMEYVQNRFNMSVVGAEYYQAAMKYFRDSQKFVNPLFIVVSNDLNWAEKNVAGPDVFFAGKNDTENPGHDLALLSLCNHSIIGYGTYGLWTAMYAGGETVALKTTKQIDRVLKNKPNWHLVDLEKPGVVIP